MRHILNTFSIAVVLATSAMAQVADWTEVTTANSPSAREGLAMAYDSARGKTVIFGGGSIVGVGAFHPGGEACFTHSGLGHWRGIGINERRFRHTRPSGHFVRSGDTQRPCSVAGISDDVFLRVQHCVVGDVQPGWSGFDAAISASVGGYPRDVAR